jgi:hypothetical protein
MNSIVRVRETRITQIISHVLIGLSIFLVPYPLAYIPTAVLDGLFLYMAITSLSGNQMFERITLLFMEQVCMTFFHVWLFQLTLSLFECSILTLQMIKRLFPFHVISFYLLLSFHQIQWNIIDAIINVVSCQTRDILRLLILPITTFDGVLKERSTYSLSVSWLNWESCVSLASHPGPTLKWSSRSSFSFCYLSGNEWLIEVVSWWILPSHISIFAAVKQPTDLRSDHNRHKIVTCIIDAKYLDALDGEHQ